MHHLVQKREITLPQYAIKVDAPQAARKARAGQFFTLGALPDQRKYGLLFLFPPRAITQGRSAMSSEETGAIRALRDSPGA